MTLQTASGSFSASDAYNAIRGLGFSAKSVAQNSLASCQNGNIDTLFVFRLLDQIASFVTSFTTWKAIPGLDTYATSLGYSGSMVSDCNGCITAAQAITAWVVANFPTEADGFLKDFKLNADGSRTPASFTPAQTGGLQTALTNFIATIN